MKPYLRSIALAAAMSLAATSASAQETMTLSTWGNGILFIDELGLFGPPGKRPMTDVPFHLAMSAGTSGMQQSLRPGAVSFTSVAGLDGQLSGVMTVNGQAWQWDVDDPTASVDWSRDGNSVSMFAVGTDGATGFKADVYQVLMPGGSSPQFIESDDYRDTVQFHDVLNRTAEDGKLYSGAYLRITGSLACETCPGGSREGLTWFYSDDPVDALWTVSPVPEPSAWLMLAGGLGLLAAARRPRLLASAR